MNIAVDLDDCLIDLISNLALFHNDVYGTDLKKGDFLSYCFNEIWGGSMHEGRKKVIEFMDSDYYKNVVPILGSQDALVQIKGKGHNLHIVTGREHRFEKITANCVSEHFDGIFSGLHHCNIYGESGVKTKKSDICFNLGASIIIEDDLMNVRDCASAGIKVLVFDNPWNQGDLPDGATRVYSWEEILKIVSEFD